MLFVSIYFIPGLHFIFLTLTSSLSKCTIFSLYVLMVTYRIKLWKVVSGLHVPFGGKTLWCSSYGIVCLFFKLHGAFHLRFE